MKKAFYLLMIFPYIPAFGSEGGKEDKEVSEQVKRNLPPFMQKVSTFLKHPAVIASEFWIVAIGIYGFVNLFLERKRKALSDAELAIIQNRLKNLAIGTEW